MVKVNAWMLIVIVLVVISVAVLLGRPGFSEQKTIGSFVVDPSSSPCTELNRTVVYLFGSPTCPHCLWEEPIIQNVTAKFGSVVSFHENIGTSNDMEVFSKYDSSGYVPLIVIGCKYYRVGSGETIGAAQEADVLTALMCSLTDGQPLSECSKVEDLIKQVG